MQCPYIHMDECPFKRKIVREYLDKLVKMEKKIAEEEKEAS